MEEFEKNIYDLEKKKIDYDKIKLNNVSYFFNNNLDIENIFNNLVYLLNGELSYKNISNKIKNDKLLNLFQLYCFEKNITINYDSIIDDNNIYDDSLQLYFNETRGKKPLSNDRVNELIINYHNGDISSRNELIEHNQMLVISIAKRYCKHDDLLDFIQEGNIGLLKAIENYDIKRECKFSTYAVFWIKQCIFRKLYNDKYILHQSEYTQRCKKSFLEGVNQLQVQLGRNPTEEEICSFLNISKKRMHELKKDCSFEIVSLSQKRYGENEEIDFISGEDNNFDNIYYKDLRKNIKNYINNTSILNDLEKDTVLSLYGFYGERENMRQVAKRHNCTFEWIRQVRDKAICKLKNDENFKHFSIYYGKCEKEKVVKNKKTFFEVFDDYSKLEIINAIQNLDYIEQAKLFKKYGVNLDEEIKEINVDHILNKIKHQLLLQKNTTHTYVINIENYKILDQFSYKQIRLLQKKYGNYLEKYTFEKLDENEKYELNNIFNTLKLKKRATN